MGPKPPHLSPAGSSFSVNREYSHLNGDGEKKKYLPDEVLDMIGARNKTLLVGMCSASFIWVLGAMPLMASGFTSDTNNATMRTVIDDFNLTGENSYLAEIPTSAYMAGNMAGGTFLAQASDRFGRRPVLLLALSMFSLSGILASFSPSILIYSLLRACQGCFYTGSCVTGWVAGYEMSPPKMRPLATLLFRMAWLLGYSAVAPLAYNADSWRQLVFYTALPSLPFALWIYFFLPETLHFLVSKRKTKEMGVWLEKICGDQKSPVSSEQILLLQENSEKSSL
ncbi:unnamed protein product, partial [Mesorhabditis belari]|uniref:Major facilitator superfamily (MFS) profile domain-containing protein n=1 Tax=Mesorhabditis belari TaxID=2138241 RepID=A0AAF3EN30_9BILA